jgi:hypothetical protein
MERLLSRLQVAPSTVTTAGLVLCLLVPAVAGRGGSWPFFAAVLVPLAAWTSTVARRMTETRSVYGSVADRVGEACWVAAFWVLGVPGLLSVAVGGLCWLHEYVRTQGICFRGGGRVEGTVDGPRTVGERPGRVAMAVAGLVLAGAAGQVSPDLAAGTATVVAAGWLLLCAFGISELFRRLR